MFRFIFETFRGGVSAIWWILIAAGLLGLLAPVLDPLLSALENLGVVGTCVLGVALYFTWFLLREFHDFARSGDREQRATTRQFSLRDDH